MAQQASIIINGVQLSDMEALVVANALQTHNLRLKKDIADKPASDQPLFARCITSLDNVEGYLADLGSQ